MKALILFLMFDTVISAEVLTYSRDLLLLLHPGFTSWHFGSGRFVRDGGNLTTLRRELNQVDRDCLLDEEKQRNQFQAERLKVSQNDLEAQAQINQGLRVALNALQLRCNQSRQERYHQVLMTAAESRQKLLDLGREIDQAAARLASGGVRLLRHAETLHGIEVREEMVALHSLGDEIHPLKSYLNQDFERLSRIEDAHGVKLKQEDPVDRSLLESLRTYVERHRQMMTFPAVVSKTTDASSRIMETMLAQWSFTGAPARSLLYFLDNLRAQNP